MPNDATGAAADLPLDPAPPPPVPVERPHPIAHWTHTAALLLALLITTISGHLHAAALLNEDASKAFRYLSTVFHQWLLLGAVIAGVYYRRTFFLQAFRSRANSWGQSLGLGAMVYVMGLLALSTVALALHFTPLGMKTNPAVVLALLPHTPLEFVWWFGLSLTAGICEELIFRGYLLQQISAWTGRPMLGVMLSALIFGSVHLYEGAAAILPLSALAVVYGLVVRHFKGDLRAVMVAHTLQDFLVAFLVLAKPYLEHYQPKH